MTTPYLSLEQLLHFLAEPQRTACGRLLEDNRERFLGAPGSSHNHQAWPGGYGDHVTETMNLAIVLYGRLGGLRPLPFTLADALVVLFLHDLEKPWRYERDPATGGWKRAKGQPKATTRKVTVEQGNLAIEKPWRLRSQESAATPVKGKQDRHAFREAKMAEYDITLTSEQANALKYVEGENDDYSARRRVMGPLAAFCHLCDLTSARLWFDRPLVAGETWGPGRRT